MAFPRAIHDYVTSLEALADMSKWLGTSDLILVPDVEPSNETLARVFKAIIGVIAKEHGKEHTRKFVIDFVMPYLQDQHVLELWDIEQPKEVLNHILSNDGRPPYEPRLMWETGRNTIEPMFVVGLYVDRELIGSCELIELIESSTNCDCVQLGASHRRSLRKWPPWTRCSGCSRSDRRTLCSSSAKRRMT